jgi:ribosome-binding factor A
MDISITDVKVDKELAFADIYFSALDGTSRLDEILKGFKSARGFIRTQLASRINLRTFPRLRFHWDPTFEQAERIDRLISSLNISKKSDANNPSSKGIGKNLSSIELEGSEND